MKLEHIISILVTWGILAVVTTVLSYWFAYSWWVTLAIVVGLFVGVVMLALTIMHFVLPRDQQQTSKPAVAVSGSTIKKLAFTTTKRVAEEPTEPTTKFGGVPFGLQAADWPSSPKTGKPMYFLAPFAT